MCLVNWLSNNITWVKDLFSIVFSLVAIIVAVLTYLKARKTLLQPIRTQVIKKQSALLTELLNFLSTSQKRHTNYFDYMALVELNMYSLLLEYGFVLNKSKNLIKYINTNSSGGLFFLKNNDQLDEVERVSMFGSENKPSISRKKKFEDLKKGVVKIQMLHYTKTYMDTLDKLEEFASNPFLPKQILLIIVRIIKNSQENLTVKMKSVLENWLVEFYDRYKKDKKNVRIVPSGVYNEFNSVSLSHRKDVFMLKNEIRKYLMIDEKW